MFAFAVLSIDVGMLYVTHCQLQSAADASALAGAMGLVTSGGLNATAIDYAITFAGENEAFIGSVDGIGNEKSPVVINEADVQFPDSMQVRVTTHRTEVTADPLRTYFLQVIDPLHDGLTDVTASATAVYTWDCGSNCLRPWAPPDRWFDADGDSTFNPHPVTNPGEYYDPDLTGYNAPADLGAPITFKLGKSTDAWGSEWYFAVNFPPINKGSPVTGANQYRSWIQGCVDEDVIVEPGDTLRLEKGNMVGPTIQGFNDLFGLDPGAYWDAGTGEVVTSVEGGVSPREIKACLFDPEIGRINIGGGDGVVVVKVIAFFLEGIDSKGFVTGRFIDMADPAGVACDDPEDPSFLYSVQLVE